MTTKIRKVAKKKRASRPLQLLVGQLGSFMDNESKECPCRILSILDFPMLSVRYWNRRRGEAFTGMIHAREFWPDELPNDDISRAGLMGQEKT